MSDVIRCLESIGRIPMTTMEYAATLACFDLEEGERRALLDRDQVSLRAQIDGARTMVFAIMAADEHA
ncbi:hypothetical protein [Cognatiluteimonas telluris]|jgi:hypothetical protein|uniref:hypothetical protein n=1 Tax=Cognatiluteimonas telluris TaxID=1104775 RepID=UPI00140C97F3|nr:hypothetical protein [Lysobacter telluris]